MCSEEAPTVVLDSIILVGVLSILAGTMGALVFTASTRVIRLVVCPFMNIGHLCVKYLIAH